jgi:hypothetical protein
MSATEAPRPEPHRFVVLDSWRGIAALAIVLRHISGSGPLLEGPVHEGLSLAVDFFFVLSGFVISVSYGDRLTRGFPMLRFMALRWGRIWPLHAVMVLLYALLELGLLFHGAGGMPAGREAFTGPRDLAALPVSFFLLAAWLWPGRDLWNTQSWSVSVELGLYLGAALLWRMSGRWANALGTVLAVAAMTTLWQFDSAYYEILRGIAGFGLGMGCWGLWRQWSAVPLAPGIATALELAALPLILLVLGYSTNYFQVDLLFALTVLLFAREAGAVSRALGTAPARWLGAISYSLYMVHMFVVGRICDVIAVVQEWVGARWIITRLGGEDTLLLAPLPATLVALGMVGISLIVAWLAWRFVEWPARAASRRLAARIGTT